MSPLWLLGGYLVAGELPESHGRFFAGSAAVAEELEPLTPAASAEVASLAGIDPDAADAADETAGTEVASLAPLSEEPGLARSALAGAPAAPTAEAGGIAPGAAAPADGVRVAAAEPILVPQPGWDGAAGDDEAADDSAVDTDETAASVPIPRPRPDWLVDGDGIVTQRESVAALDREPQAARGDARIVIHHGTRAAEAAARRLDGILDGIGTTELRPVDAAPSRGDVRYFHPQDRAAAEAVNLLLRRAGYGSDVKDFTHFEPPPSLGTVEVWLPG